MCIQTGRRPSWTLGKKDFIGFQKETRVYLRSSPYSSGAPILFGQRLKALLFFYAPPTRRSVQPSPYYTQHPRIFQLDLALPRKLKAETSELREAIGNERQLRIRQVGQSVQVPSGAFGSQVHALVTFVAMHLLLGLECGQGFEPEPELCFTSVIVLFCHRPVSYGHFRGPVMSDLQRRVAFPSGESFTDHLLVGSTSLTRSRSRAWWHHQGEAITEHLESEKNAREARADQFRGRVPGRVRGDRADGDWNEQLAGFSVG